jgi:type III secretion system FlhB-like substrate exporter
MANLTRTAVGAAAISVLAGCATVTVDRAMDEAQGVARDRTGVAAERISSDAQQQQVSAEVDRLLAQPLTADDAVRIAMVNSPSFQALMHENAATMASAVQSGRLLNPVFTFDRLVRGDDVDIGRLLSFQIVDLLTWPLRTQMASLRIEQDKIKTTGDIVERAADARKAWIEAVAAQQTLAYYRDVLTAAEASAELARRMQGVGNWSRLQRAREQAFYADAAVQLARAQQAHLTAREALVRLLGLTRIQAEGLKLPARLPDLPPAARDSVVVTQTLLDQRLDVQAAMRALEHTAKLGNLTQIRSVVSRIEAGVVRNSETGAPDQRGYEIELPLPVFDPGDALRAEMRSTYQATVYRARQVMLDAQSQTAEAYGAYRTAFDIARHYRDEIVPLRKNIAEENLLRYNGMLIGVFELLADAREQVGSVIQAIEAQREFWIADAMLQTTLIGRPEALPRMFEPAQRNPLGGGGAPH